MILLLARPSRIQAQRSHLVFAITICGKAERFHVALREHVVLTFGGGLEISGAHQHSFTAAGADLMMLLVCAGGGSDWREKLVGELALDEAALRRQQGLGEHDTRIARGSCYAMGCGVSWGRYELSSGGVDHG